MHERHRYGWRRMATCYMPAFNSHGWWMQQMKRSLHFWNDLVTRTAASRTRTYGTICCSTSTTSRTCRCSCGTWRRCVQMLTFVCLAPTTWQTTLLDLRTADSRNHTRSSHSYCRISIGSRMRSTDRWYFQWPGRNPNPVFKVTAFLKSNISKTVHFRDKVTKEH